MPTTRRWPILLAIAAVIACPAVDAEERTIVGELVDPATYVKDGRHGPDLAEQTYEAVAGGQTLAVLEDGTGMLYLLLAEQPGEDPNELAYDYVSQQVTVRGAVHERGGLRGIVAASIEPLTAAVQPAAAPD